MNTLADKAIKELKTLNALCDPEMAGRKADAVLCNLLISLGYKDVVESYYEVDRWYS